MAHRPTLLILEKPEPPTFYRGFGRSWPSYQGRFSEHHPVKRSSNSARSAVSLARPGPRRRLRLETSDDP